MWIYSAESILDNKEYNFAYVDDTLIDAILQIKIKNKIQIVEVNNIDSKNDNIKLNDIDDLSIIAKNKFDKLPIDTISFFDMTDKNTIKNLVNLNANNFDYASDELKKDVAFVRALLNKKGESIQEDKFDVLKYMSKELKKDKKFAERLVDTYRIVSFLQYFDKKITDSSQFISSILKYRKINLNGIYSALGDKLKNNLVFLSKCVIKKPAFIFELPLKLTTNIEFANMVVSEDKDLLKFFPKSIRTNQELVDFCVDASYGDIRYNLAYVSMRPTKKIAYPTFNTNSCSDSVFAFNNIVVMSEEVAKEILVKNEILNKYILNYEKFLDSNELYECKVPSRNWKSLKKYNDKIILEFITKEIKGPGLRNFIQLLIEKYKYDVEWYEKEYAINDGDVMITHHDCYEEAWLPNIYTHYFYDEEGYAADDYIIGDPNFLNETIEFSNFNFFNN